MGINAGMVKYILLAPLYRPLNFFTYGIGFVAVWSALRVLATASTWTPRILVDAYIAYLSTKYLPPTSLVDIAVPIVVGAVAAGLKWRIAMARL